VSGDHHFLLLTEAGVVHSAGVSELGQLGRRFRALRSTQLSEKGRDRDP
jgi:hypothetical protein